MVLLRDDMGTLNCWLQNAHTPTAGVVLSHLTTRRVRFGMNTVSHRPEPIASPVDFKRHHYQGLWISRTFLRGYRHYGVLRRSRRTGNG